MNNHFLIPNKVSGTDRFQLQSGFLRSNWLKISISLVIGFGVVISDSIFTQSSGAISSSFTQERPVVTVQASALHQAEQVSMKRTFIGQVEASQNSDLGFELDGKISRILADEGDRVIKGQILAYLDIERLQAKKNELVAALKQAGQT